MVLSESSQLLLSLRKDRGKRLYVKIIWCIFWKKVESVLPLKMHRSSKFVVLWCVSSYAAVQSSLLCGAIFEPFQRKQNHVVLHLSSTLTKYDKILGLALL